MCVRLSVEQSVAVQTVVCADALCMLQYLRAVGVFLCGTVACGLTYNMGYVGVSGEGGGL